MRRTIDLAILAVVLYIFAGYVFPLTLVGNPLPSSKYATRIRSLIMSG